MTSSGPRPRSLTVVVALALALVVLLGSVSLAAPAGARPVKTRISAKVPKAATAGQPVLIAGKIRPKSRNRDVQVQILKGSVWQLLDRTRTAKDSSFALSVTLPAGKQSVRIVSRSKTAKLGSTKARPIIVAPAPPSPDRGPTLADGAVLSGGQYLRSPNGRYLLIMQSDGLVVLYDRTAAKNLWSAGRAGSGNRLQLQTDGNLVVIGDSGLVWQAGSAGFDVNQLVLQDDGNLVIYSRGVATWTYGAGYLGNKMLSGTNLPAGAVRRSPSRRYSLVMQNDGNLVVFDGANPLWSPGTTGNNFAAMQVDGNLCVYPVGGAPAVFNTATFDSPGAQLELQDDGNLVIYQNGVARWSWRTGKI